MPIIAGNGRMSNPLADPNELLAGLARRAPGHGERPAPPLSAAPPLLVGDFARLDHDRAARTGTPEVVYAPGKTTEQLVAIVDQLLARCDRAIVSRLDEAQHAALEAAYAAQPAIAIERRAGCPTAVVRRQGVAVTPTGGHVGILTAGTADVPAADEARVMAEALGCRVSLVCDVGVAGLHRLFEPLGRLLEEGAGALVVAAGMDGALPSVVAGLSPVPVIGLPTSVGYGAGGDGVAALLSMLQSCAPGLAVVNIDNGIGAGAMAAMIANLAARGRPD
jgi:NCAIR mutase (PurE)-related protein